MACAVGVVAMLAACGGGGDPDPSAGTIGGSDVAPVVTVQPADVSVTAPASATFTAAASGSPAPTVQWQRSNDHGTTWAAIIGATSASYTTPASVAGDDGALFRALFANAAGSAASNGARLTVVSTAPAPGLSLLAGGIGSFGTIDGTGANARFGKAEGLAVDAAGNLYVADQGNANIRKITPAGVVTTLAGSALHIGSADGTGTAARFGSPWGIAVDAAGNVYVADFGNGNLRKITPAGVVTTLAGGNVAPGSLDGVGSGANLGQPQGLAVDAAGTLYMGDQAHHSIRKISSTGSVTTLAGNATAPGGTVDGTGTAARFYSPQCVAVDAFGNVYVGDGDYVVRKITPAGVVTTLAGSPGNPGTADGTGAAARFDFPRGIAVDATGNIFVSDANNSTIRKVTQAGVVTTIAGTARNAGFSDGNGAAASFTYPTGLAFDASGALFVGDEGVPVIRKITPTYDVSTFAGPTPHPVSVDGTGAAAGFWGPSGPAVDAAGNVFLADTGNNTIRKITPAGVVTTFAGSAGEFGSADGSGAGARFYRPTAVALDTVGNLYVADSNNSTLRRITPAGVVTTLAGRPGVGASIDGTGAVAGFESVSFIALDAAGNIYVADTVANTIRKVTPAGVVSTLAGQADMSGSTDGTGAAARFDEPQGLTVDPAGNVYVVDTGNNVVRKITPAGVVTTLAGTAGVSGSADGAGAAASFQVPSAMTIDPSGNLYVADYANVTVRKVTPSGVVSTLVGNVHSFGIRLGTDPNLMPVSGLAWSPSGQLIITSVGAVLIYTLP